MLRSNEIKRLLNRPTIKMFVDSGDLYTVAEENGLIGSDDFPDSLAASLKNFCRSIGTLQESLVFDDTWALPKEVWKSKGYTNIDVKMDINDESRVISILTLRAYEAAVSTNGLTTFAFVVGCADYSELLQAINKLGHKTLLIGVEGRVRESFVHSANIWMPLQHLLKGLDKSSNENGGMDSFVKLIDSLENSRLDFIGVKYLIRDVLPTIGLSDPTRAREVVSQAEATGVIELYEEANSRGYHAVEACRLRRDSAVVKRILAVG